jgi:dehydrogenase/reductase SDR family protein 1
MSLDGSVALVTGASRGLGRGIARSLSDAGATVYATGRTIDPDSSGIVAVPCDHRDDGAVASVFELVERESGRLDLLVNNATAVPGLGLLFSDRPFWELDVAEEWDGLIDVGLRSHFVAAQHAARIMVRQGRGLIVNVSSAGAATKIGVVPYGVGKAALDHMTKEMAEELRPHGVAVVSLWPPPSKTEGMLGTPDAEAHASTWSSPEFTGRVVAALAEEAGVLARSGSVLKARPLAAELGVDDDAVLA